MVVIKQRLVFDPEFLPMLTTFKLLLLAVEAYELLNVWLFRATIIWTKLSDCILMTSFLLPALLADVKMEAALVIVEWV